MKRARACRKCGCTERAACIEFDSKGRGYPCFWVSSDGCSACFCGDSPPHAALINAGLFDGTKEAFTPFVVAPQLAGMVARRRG